MRLTRSPIGIKMVSRAKNRNLCSRNIFSRDYIDDVRQTKFLFDTPVTKDWLFWVFVVLAALSGVGAIQRVNESGGVNTSTFSILSGTIDALVVIFSAYILVIPLYLVRKFIRKRNKVNPELIGEPSQSQNSGSEEKSPGASENQVQRKRSPNWIIIFLVVIIGLWFIGSSTSGDNTVNSSSNSSSSSSSDIPTYDDSWIPEGFSGVPDDDNVAWRWATTSETNCTYSSGSCWSVVMISKNGCPNGIYSELAILDSSGVQIDFTSDSTTRVLPNTKVKLTFDTFNEEAEKARIGEISCR
jgi:hypothetical protein